MEQVNKEYQTELEPREKRLRKATEKVESVLRFAKLPESTERLQKESTFAGNQASFSFEKEKLQQLQIGPSYATDVNDDNIQKLKEDILRQCQVASQQYDNYANVLHVVSVILLSLNVIEIIGCFFLLLILSIQYVPSDQIMLWIGSAMLLCVGEIFIALKAINSSQGKVMLELQSFVRLIVVFLCLFGAAFIVLVLTLSLITIPVAKPLTEGQQSLLFFVKSMLLIVIILKVIGQIIFLHIGRTLVRHLQAITSEHPTPSEANIH